jgi:hypothetical protein
MKKEALKKILEIAQANNISINEIESEFASTKTLTSNLEAPSRLTTALMYFGGLLTFLGIVFFIEMNWSQINSTLRVLISLGTAIVTYLSAILLQKNSEYKILQNLLHFISAGLLPTGLYVLAFETGYLETIPMICNIIIMLLLFIHYTFNYKKFLLSGFKFLSFAYLQLFYLAVLEQITNNNFSVINFSYLYLSEIYYLILGICMFAYAYNNYKTEPKSFSNFYYFFGTISLLGGYFNLADGFHLVYEFSFPIICIVMLALSNLLKQKSILIPALFAFIAYLVDITNTYFVESIGWPLALVFMGIVIIGTTLMSLKKVKSSD